MTESTTPTSLFEPLRDEFDCPLCHSLLFEPIAITCGHIFCRHCLKRALAHSAACPMCRTPCFMDASASAPSFLIASLITRCFPVEARQRAIEAEETQAELSSTRLGLFFLRESDTAFWPGMPVELYVHEARYVELMRRCMENGCMFGICRSPDSPYGAAVKISNCRPGLHGRLHVTAKVSTRFRFGNSAAPPSGGVNQDNVGGNNNNNNNNNAPNTVSRGGEPEPGTYGLHYGQVQFYEDSPIRDTGVLGSSNTSGGGNGETGGGRGNRLSSNLPLLTAPLAEIPEFAHILYPGATQFLLSMTEPQACNALRDKIAEVLIRLMSSLPHHYVYQSQLLYGPIPGSSGNAANPERWSHYAAAVLALSTEEKAIAFETTRVLRRLIVIYCALERMEIPAEAGVEAPSSSSPSLQASVNNDGGNRSGEARVYDGGNSEHSSSSSSSSSSSPASLSLCPLTSVQASRALDIMNPHSRGRGREGRISQLIHAVTTSAGASSLLILVTLIALLFFLRGTNHHL